MRLLLLCQCLLFFSLAVCSASLVEKDERPLSHPYLGHARDFTPRALAERDTNARRFAMGLTPKRPATLPERVTAPGRIRNPSRVVAPRQGGLSPSGLTGLTGTIAVFAGASLLGLISQDLNINGGYQVGLPAAVFTLSGTTGYIDIAVQGAQYPDLGGGLSGGGGSAMGQGSAAFAFIAAVQQTTGPASNYDNSVGSPSESNIWSINTATLEITASWTNPTGDRVDVTIFNDISFSELDLTGDLSTFSSTFADSVEPVTFYFVPA